MYFLCFYAWAMKNKLWSTVITQDCSHEPIKEEEKEKRNIYTIHLNPFYFKDMSPFPFDFSSVIRDLKSI